MRMKEIVGGGGAIKDGSEEGAAFLGLLLDPPMIYTVHFEIRQDKCRNTYVFCHLPQSCPVVSDSNGGIILTWYLPMGRPCASLRTVLK